MDQSNFPIWEDLMSGWQAEIWQSHFANDEVYRSYNSWYLRAGVPKSQEISFEAYDLSTWEKFIAFLYPTKRRKPVEPDEETQKRVEATNRQKYEESIKFEPKKKRLGRALKEAIPIPEKLSTVYPQVLDLRARNDSIKL